MRVPRLDANVTVFALFFGLALLDAFGNRRWLAAVLWIGFGLVFLRADNLRRHR
jgi:hypothetical protein